MNENWAICHDNGKPGQRGVSDGYASESQAMRAVESMTAHGITVYSVWRTE